MAETSLLRDLVVIFAVAVVVVGLLRRVGVPSIAGFVLAGLLVGPGALSLVSEPHDVELLAEVGVALLLFGIGLELQLSLLRRLLRPVLMGGTIQVALTGGLTALIASLAGLPTNSAIFLGFMMAVSSTAIVLRGLEERSELEAPHGRLTLGILVFQDLCVVPMMLALPVLAGTGGDTGELFGALLRALGVLVGVLIAAWVVVPRALHWVAMTRQRDLFVLTAFLIAVGTAWVVSLAGISLAIGAFLAGMVVAGSEYRHQAAAELIPFKEVLTSLFFVSIGMLFNPAILWEQPLPVLGWLAVIVLGKAVIVFVTAAVMRLPARVCVRSAAALAQVGEFSFVLLHAAEPGLLPEAIEPAFLAGVILSMLITPLGLALGPGLAAGVTHIRVLTRLLGVAPAEDANAEGHERSGHVVIAGFGIAGRALAGVLKGCGIDYVIVDLNPESVRKAARDGEPIYYGDVTNPEVLEHLDVANARDVVLAVNDPAAAERSLRAIRAVAPSAHVLVRCRYLAEVEPLLQAGASEVVPAELEAAVEVAARVMQRCGVRREIVVAEVERVRQASAGPAAKSEGAPASR